MNSNGKFDGYCFPSQASSGPAHPKEAGRNRPGNHDSADYDYCGFSRFKFDNTRNVYISDPFTCNTFPKPHIDSKITKIYKNGKVVEVTIKIAYIKYETNEKEEVTKLVYKHLNDQNPLEKHILLTDNSYDINNILGKLDTYKFTFTLNSNNYYYFTKVEKI